MDRKKILTLTFCSIIFSIIFILLSYFGIFRYINLHLQSVESYTKNYKNLEKAENPGKIFLVLTSTEDDISKIGPTINSLYDQTVSVDEVSLSIPFELNKKLSQDVKDNVWIHNFNNDYGELNSYIPSLLKMEDSNDIVIIVSNGMVYGRDFVEEMLDASEKSGEKIIYGGDKLSSGILLKPDFIKEDFELWNKNDGGVKEWLEKFSDVESENINYFEIYKSLL